LGASVLVVAGDVKVCSKPAKISNQFERLDISKAMVVGAIPWSRG
jgi:hypothetical protein